MNTSNFQPTVIRSMEALINGKIVKVDQLKGNDHKQHIEYRIHADSGNEFVDVSSDYFWNMKPEFIRFN